MKIRISTLAGETLYYVDVLMLLAQSVPWCTRPDAEGMPKVGDVLVIDAISNAPAAIVRRADDRDCVAGVGLAFHEILTVPAAAGDD